MAARKHLELQVIRLFALAFLVTFFTVTSALASQDSDGGKDQLLKQIRDTQVIGSAIDISEIPEFTDQPFITLHDNIPDFYLWQLTAEPYIFFSPLDKYGRTMTAMACLSEDTLPTEQRGQIGDVKPSGWQTVRYDDLIEELYLLYAPEEKRKEELYRGFTLRKLYPEWDAEARFKISGTRFLYCYCNRHGLFRVSVR